MTHQKCARGGVKSTGVLPDVAGVVSSPPRQVFGDPPLGGRPQPRQVDEREVQASRWPSTRRSQVSQACSVSGGTHRVGTARPGTAADPALATRLLREVGDRGDLGSPQSSQSGRSTARCVFKVLGAALLEAVEDLDSSKENSHTRSTLVDVGDAGFTSARREPPWCRSRRGPGRTSRECSPAR